jgi:hypothetical protein
MMGLFRADKVGLNARTLGDILLIDAAVLGTVREHAAARKAVRAKPVSDFTVGLPQFPFVELELPTDAYNMFGLKNGPVSVALKAKYDKAIEVSVSSRLPGYLWYCMVFWGSVCVGSRSRRELAL